MMFVVLSCKPNSEIEQSRTLAKKEPYYYDLDSIRARGKLVALLGNSSSSYFIYRGRPMGYEYELLEMFCKSIGVKLEVVIPDNLNNVFDLLNQGRGDLVAASLTVTKERNELVNFSDYLMTTRQVLVQRKPKNWRSLTADQLNRRLIRNQIRLIGKKIYVRKNSAYYTRLNSLSDEIGGSINIQTVPGSIETEELIRMVSKGEIDYTVSDEQLARLTATYYSNIDTKTPISFPQRIAWAIRSNSPQLQKAINDWIKSVRKTSDFNHIYKKYYSNRKAFALRMGSGYLSNSGGRISVYDELISKYANDVLQWDWLLLASLIYQESKFDNTTVSWAGAKGLMQIMPETALRFAADTSHTPENNIQAGVNYLNWLQKFWAKRIPDSTERLNFILASYNVGQGHVLDAQRLAKKYGNDPLVWEGSVAFFLREKSNKKYFTDPVVKHGYCRGSEPVKYVREILKRYHQYTKLIIEEEEKENQNIAFKEP